MNMPKATNSGPFFDRLFERRPDISLGLLDETGASFVKN
jgi:hypothetical protein